MSAYEKTKAQISCTVIAQLISIFVFATLSIVNSSSTFIQSFKLLLYSVTVQASLCLV